MKKKTKKFICNLLAILLLGIALVWICTKFIHLGKVEFTENAQVRQLIVPVNSRVPGFIREIRFEEFDYVEQGDTLALIEDAEFRFLVAQAEANCENARTGKVAMQDVISTTRSNLTVSDSGIEEARVHLENAQRNFERFKNLYAEKAVTRQQFDDIKTNYEAAKARYEMLCNERSSIESLGREQQTRLGQNEAGIRLAEAALDLAHLNLSYTAILAPCSGYTGRKKIQEGQLVQPGQTLVEVVDESSKWVLANYKETQTTDMRKGQLVRIEIDALPGIEFEGRVSSISHATGASFSLLPQDNSSGNFIKIEQRIPVRIEFTEKNSPEAMARVSAGMNVECEVVTESEPETKKQKS